MTRDKTNNQGGGSGNRGLRVKHHESGLAECGGDEAVVGGELQRGEDHPLRVLPPPRVVDYQPREADLESVWSRNLFTFTPLMNIHEGC